MTLQIKLMMCYSAPETDNRTRLIGITAKLHTNLLTAETANPP